jgi:hypothetical protein
MFVRKSQLMWAVAPALVACMIIAGGFAVTAKDNPGKGGGKGNSGKGGGGKDTTLPTVVSTAPHTDAVDVSVNTSIVAVFSEAMKSTTINTDSFQLTGPGALAVTGAVSYDQQNNAARFAPTSVLAFSTVYTATITTAATDKNGNALASANSWSFTTGTTADADAPTVTSTNPVNLASNVAVNQDITVVFSEWMNSATVTEATFTLTVNGSTPVSGSVTSDGTTATFNPSKKLAKDSAFTATITTGVADLAGNQLAFSYVWNFDTGTVKASGPGPVVLGNAGNYVILAKAGVSTTGTTAIVGDLGISPIAATAFTGFGMIMDVSNQFATSPFVTGRLYAADFAVPTPANLTTAVLDMQTAYTDAAGRTLPDFTELGAGNINGLTLVPGLYKWGTGVSMSTGVLISGGANDVWIFQIAQDLTIGNGAIVTLSGGAQAKNIFWQVAGQTTLGTTSDFKGIILCQTQIVMQTGAVVLGRALAQTAVTLDATSITAP